ncbi:MAG: hypothetical protein CMP23_01815 [Rickettsiales bacterium]|nr:hypothetical protein [Rickettsiales bacterium]|tara:strand:- start:1032 stop:1685 length:654 start_codon:yes stop_codon:yes gene_type:complete
MKPIKDQFWLLLCIVFFTACGTGEGPAQDAVTDDQTLGLITTLGLHFTPEGGGDALSFFWRDSQGESAPLVDQIPLPDGSNHGHHDTQNYILEIEAWNDLEEPPRDVTLDIQEASEEFQFFFTGSGVEGPATGDNSGAVISHAYADTDAGGLPLGLSNTVSTLDWGSGELTVTLRHLLDGDGHSVKEDGLVGDVAAGSFASIAGENKLQVTFDLEVQ